MKKWLTFLFTLCALGGCNSAEESGSTVTAPADTEAASISDYDFADKDGTFTNECDITLGDTVSISGTGAWLDGNHITISDGGVYTVTGDMPDGKIKIESAEAVKLILNNASITNKSGSVISSDEGKLIIECVEGSANLLTAYGEKNEGINCDGELLMESGSLDIISEDDGIKVKSAFYGENITLDIKCGREDNGEGKGKGIKAAGITLKDCEITVNSADHSIKSDGEAVINGGSYSLTSTLGKGIASVGKLSLNGADVSIPQSVEGIESKSVIDINGGNISITASDDGINTGGDEKSDNTMNINGGNITVNAGGDGLDSNGDINITGGRVVIFGTDSGNECPVDCGERFGINISGGELIAFGNMNMQTRPDCDYTMSRSLNGGEGDEISVTSESGDEIFSVKLPKTAKGVLFCGDGAKTAVITNNGESVNQDDSLSDAPFNQGKPFKNPPQGDFPQGEFPNDEFPQGEFPQGEPPQFPKRDEDSAD